MLDVVHGSPPADYLKIYSTSSHIELQNELFPDPPSPIVIALTN